ncbi:hypothetical protein H5410_033386, partial [Solanum commersonii]
MYSYTNGKVQMGVRHLMISCFQTDFLLQQFSTPEFNFLASVVWSDTRKRVSWISATRFQQLRDR